MNGNWIPKSSRPKVKGYYVCFIPNGTSIHVQEIYYDGYQFDDDNLTHYAPMKFSISEVETWESPDDNNI